MVRLGLMLLLVLTSYSLGIAAPGGTAPRTPPASKNQDAEKFYKEGLRHRDAAWVYEEKIAGTPDEKTRAGYEKFVQRTYKRALAEFEKAVKIDDKFHQAFSSLGYVKRKTGDMDGALEAYDRALYLNPTYSEAIEYRAETYFILGRMEEAQKAFDVLVGLNKTHAARLLDFAEGWSGKLDDEKLKAKTMAWVKEKREALGEIKAVEKW